MRVLDGVAEELAKIMAKIMRMGGEGRGVNERLAKRRADLLRVCVFVLGVGQW